jgi:hypothetical protein
MATWIQRTGAGVQMEVTGLSRDDRKRPDIVFWFENTHHVIDVTVTDPFNSTNTKRIHSSSSSSSSMRGVCARSSQQRRFDSRVAQYEMIHSIVEKRKTKHYRQLIQDMQSMYPDSVIRFHTAGAFTTGGMCCEFQELIKIINLMAQRETGGWDPEEVMEGLRGCIAVAIQRGNAMIVNESWNRIAHRNYRRLLKPDKHRAAPSVA